jgi:hypothetical protein
VKLSFFAMTASSWLRDRHQAQSGVTPSAHDLL